MSMYNCDKDICSFQINEVTLNSDQRAEMRDRRNTNRSRLFKGLESNENPSLDSHQSQGSYAMHTMVQDENNDYDIDDGVVFLKSALVGKQGGDMPALDARKMVCAALYDNAFKTPPEVLKNCVRVYYEAGYHVDVPVYRKNEDGLLELASSDWKGSSPSEVTEWYINAVINKSADDLNSRQLRRVTRLIKSYKASRDSWKSSMTSGLVISSLVVECYVSDERDDVSLFETMKAIRNRLNFSLEVKHPVRGEMLTKGYDDGKTKFLRDKLIKGIENLEPLFNEGCSRLIALKAWNKLYDHQFWLNLIEDEEEAQKESAKAKRANILRQGNSGVAIASGLIGVANASSPSVKNTESYGGKKYR